MKIFKRLITVTAVALVLVAGVRYTLNQLEIQSKALEIQSALQAGNIKHAEELNNARDVKGWTPIELNQ